MTMTDRIARRVARAVEEAADELELAVAYLDEGGTPGCADELRAVLVALTTARGNHEELRMPAPTTKEPASV